MKLLIPLFVFLSLNSFANDTLLRRVKNNDLNGVLDSLSNDPTVNLEYSLDDKLTSLAIATKNDNYPIAKLLVEAGANIDVYIDVNTSLVIHAYINNHLKLYDLFVEQSEFSRNIFNDSPQLLDVIGQCDVEATKELITKGARVEYRNESGITAAQIAVDYCPKILNYLLFIPHADYQLTTKDAIKLLNRKYLKESYLVFKQRGQLSELNSYSDTMSFGTLFFKFRDIELTSKFLSSDIRLNINDASILKVYALENGYEWSELLKGKTFYEYLMDKDITYLDSTDRNGYTLLYHAIKNQHIDVMNIILELAPKLVLAFDYSGETPLFDALRTGNPKIYTKIIQMTENVNVINKSGITPLFIAVVNAVDGSDIEAISLLVKKGANINFPRFFPERRTALHYAAEKGSLLVVKELIRLGAELNIRSENGNTALLNAIQFGDASVVQYLIDSGADVNLASKYSYPIMAAVKSPDLIRALVTAGANINHVDYEGKTALMFACEDTIESARILIQHAGANLEIKDKKGKAALHYCIKEKELVHSLLKRGANVNIQDSYGKTALMEAILWRRHDVIDLLISHGADIDLSNTEKYTALLLSAEAIEHNEKGIELVWKLILAGANLDAQTINGNTTLMKLIEKSLIFSKEHNSKYKDLIRYLIKNSSYINLRDYRGESALFYVLKAYKEEFLQPLLEAGADLNIKNKWGQTALASLISDPNFENLKGINALLNAGADVNLADNNGFTPLMHAIFDGDKEAFNLLLYKKANVHLRNNKGISTLVLAAMDPNLSPYFIHELLMAGANYEEARNDIKKSNMEYEYKRSALKKLREGRDYNF